MKNRIYTINDWWGGPLCGVCEFIGEKYIYQRRFDEELDMYTNDYFLTPIYDEQFETIINDDWDDFIIGLPKLKEENMEVRFQKTVQKLFESLQKFYNYKK